jgi:DNA-directed RNA polymerase specialized sigma24 family protein
MSGYRIDRSRGLNRFSHFQAEVVDHFHNAHPTPARGLVLLILAIRNDVPEQFLRWLRVGFGFRLQYDEPRSINMSNTSTSVAIQELLERIAHGDSASKFELVELACARFRKIARNMLSVSYPEIDYDGVQSVQIANAAFEHMQGFVDLDPDKNTSAKEFLFQASRVIRTTLIDLAKRLCEWDGKSQAKSLRGIQLPEHADPAKWRRTIGILESVDRLPLEQQQVVDLLFFQGCTPAEASTILGLDETTVKRKWAEARVHLVGSA